MATTQESQLPLSFQLVASLSDPEWINVYKGFLNETHKADPDNQGLTAFSTTVVDTLLEESEESSRLAKVFDILVRSGRYTKEQLFQLVGGVTDDAATSTPTPTADIH